MNNRINKILIVDDDPNQIKLIRLYLKNIELDISTAINGRHALRLLNDTKYDLIFTDFQMPEMDGETLIVKIREDLKLNTPIIVISANDSQLHVSKYKNIKVLRKPFTPGQIKRLFEK